MLVKSDENSIQTWATGDPERCLAKIDLNSVRFTAHRSAFVVALAVTFRFASYIRANSPRLSPEVFVRNSTAWSFPWIQSNWESVIFRFLFYLTSFQFEYIHLLYTFLLLSSISMYKRWAIMRYTSTRRNNNH